uniref:Uncharacterized protein n=1 Tax=Arundo donax TaxID=35708 RepID=A0A0A9D8Z9_ARUDO
MLICTTNQEQNQCVQNFKILCSFFLGNEMYKAFFLSFIAGLFGFIDMF